MSYLTVDPRDSAILKPENCFCVQLQPGDLLLWDSRTVHCSYPGDYSVASKKSTAPRESLIRAATLVSMVPRDSASEDVLASRSQI